MSRCWGTLIAARISVAATLSAGLALRARTARGASNRIEDVAPSERVQEQRQREPSGEHARLTVDGFIPPPVSGHDGGDQEEQRAGREGGARQRRRHDDRP